MLQDLLREDDKPVGLVYIGCCYKGETHVKECDLSGDRHTIRCQSTKEALKFVLDIIKTNQVEIIVVVRFYETIWTIIVAMCVEDLLTGLKYSLSRSFLLVF